MEGIAKTAQQATPTPKPEHTHILTGDGNTLRYAEIPVDIYRFFSIDLGTVEEKELSKLKDISDWAFNGVETLGDGLQKLRSLEIKLGTPKSGESRQDKIWQWVKIQRQVDDLLKRQEAISGSW